MGCVRPPAPRPCESCPYRRDVPSGVWAAEEYEKLPQYDRPTGEQPLAAFLCHQQNGRLCGGWCGTHDLANSLSFRFVAMEMHPIEVERTLTWSSPVPLFSSGQEAAEHGLRDLEDPSVDALMLSVKLGRQRSNL